MASQSVQVLSAGRHLETTRSGEAPDDALWLAAKDLERATGWALTPDGLCRDGVCMIVSDADRDRWVVGDTVCASALWRALGRPVLHDESRSVWMLGDAAADRTRELESLEAPDFTLPDITGKPHTLSDFRGKKVVLATWASW